jgi:hypothetical protein
VLTGLVIAACAALFLSRHWPQRRRDNRIGYASELVNCERVDEAIELLDAVDTRKLDGERLRSWLGLKGYALALAGRGPDALDCIDDLASIADPDDGGSQVMVCGTRAIVAIGDGRFDEAEALLESTERFSASSGPLSASNLAEVWWWRAKLAERRGDAGARRRSLEQAAGFGDVHYADRARAVLGQSVSAT